MRTALLERVRQTLASSGYYLSEENPLRHVSFDLMARRDHQLVIVKVLTNVDSLSSAVASEMRILARFLNGTALLVGERSSSRELEDGAVYVRHGINIMTAATLEEHLLEAVPPLVYAAPGGFYVNIDGPRLRELRMQRGISLGTLAEVAGVSRRAVAMYEEGMGAMVDVAAKIEDFLEEPIVVPIDPFRFAEEQQEVVVDLQKLQDAFEREVLSRIASMGFRVVPTGKSPFNAISSSAPSGTGASAGEPVILTGVADESPDLRRKARMVANIAEVTETQGAFFMAHTTTRIAIEGTPVISREELAACCSPEEILRLIEERRGKRR